MGNVQYGKFGIGKFKYAKCWHHKIGVLEKLVSENSGMGKVVSENSIVWNVQNGKIHYKKSPEPYWFYLVFIFYHIWKMTNWLFYFSCAILPDVLSYLLIKLGEFKDDTWYVCVSIARRIFLLKQHFHWTCSSFVSNHHYYISL